MKKVKVNDTLKTLVAMLPQNLKFSSNTEKYVCAWMHFYSMADANENNTFTMPTKVIEDDLKLSRKTVSIYIKSLVEKGYFSVLEKGNNFKHQATKYQSNVTLCNESIVTLYNVDNQVNKQSNVTLCESNVTLCDEKSNVTLNINKNINKNINHNINNNNNNNKELNNNETMIVNEMLYVTDKEFEKRLNEIEARYQMMMNDVVFQLEEKMKAMCENLRKKTTIINNLQQKVNELQQELKNVKVNAHAKTNISTPVKTNTNTGNRYENDTVLQLWKMLDDGVDVVSNFERLKMMKEQGRMSEKQWQRTLTKMNEFKTKQQRKSGNATTTTSTQNEQIPSDVLEKVNYAMWAVLKVQRAMNDGDDESFLQWYSVMDDCRKWVDEKSSEYDNFKEFRNIKWIGHKVNDNRFQRFVEHQKKLNSKAKASA